MKLYKHSKGHNFIHVRNTTAFVLSMFLMNPDDDMKVMVFRVMYYSLNKPLVVFYC